jgi:uncharacterized protein (DUF362 family)
LPGPRSSAPPRILPVPGYDEAAVRSAVEAILQPMLDAWLRERVANPLIVVKPNWVQESHEYEPAIWEPVITNPSVLHAVIECVARSVSGGATICICDAPHTYADFGLITARGNLVSRLDAVRRQYPHVAIELLDLRREVWKRKEEVVTERLPNAEDPRGYVRLNLGRNSQFFQHAGEGRFYGADYDSRVVNEHHRGELQEYLLSGTAIKSDLFINVPKLKTHKKTGITCCLKSLVGINGDKNWLPHHTEGAPSNGGDEFPRAQFRNDLERSIKNAGRRVALALPGVGTWAYRKARNSGKRMLGDSETVVRNGNWHGNDTCWRMALDLNRALRFGAADGTWRTAHEPKRCLAIVDGIVGGEGNGPLCPDAVASGVLFGGDDVAVVDAVACRLMGFDPARVPIVNEAFARHALPITESAMDQIVVDDQRVGEIVPLAKLDPAVPGGFEPHFGWVEHLRDLTVSGC